MALNVIAVDFGERTGLRGEQLDHLVLDEGGIDVEHHKEARHVRVWPSVGGALSVEVCRWRSVGGAMLVELCRWGSVG